MLSNQALQSHQRQWARWWHFSHLWYLCLAPLSGTSYVLPRKDYQMEFPKRLLMGVALLWAAGTSHGFLETSIGKMFFKKFTDVLDFPSVNIFLSDKSGAGQVPMDVLKSLWAMRGYSVGLQKIKSSSDVIRVLRSTSEDSLNVILLEDEADFNLLMAITQEPLANRHSWLALGDVDPIVDGEFRLRLPLDNLMTFASLHTMNVSDTLVEKVVVREIYSLDEELPYITRVLAEWYGGGPLRLPLDDWSDRRTNLTGLHLRCVTMPQEPFVYLSEPNDQMKVQLLGGYAKDVFEALQEKLGFTYTCRLPPDYKWGSLENGEWNGIMREMVTGRADVVVTSLDQNSARAKDVDFVTGIRKVGYRMVTRRPGLMDETWTSFTSELLPTAWAGTMAFVILAPPCLVFCSRFSPSETEKVSFKDAYILAIGAFAIQGSWLDVRSLSTRIVFITIFLATLVVYAHYTSALVSLLTVASTSVGFSSLQSLLEDGSHQFGFMSGTSLEDEFKVMLSVRANFESLSIEFGELEKRNFESSSIRGSNTRCNNPKTNNGNNTGNETANPGNPGSPGSLGNPGSTGNPGNPVTDGSWLDVRSLSTRIVFITIFLATLVVYAHYTSALVSLLTVASTSVGFSSLQSLLEDGSHQFGFMSGTSLEDEFKNAKQPIIREVWDQLIAPNPDNLAVSDRAGVKKVIAGRYVYMMEENIYRSMFPNQCDTQLLRGQYFTTETGFAVRQGSPLKEIFDNQLMRMRDGGVLSRSWKRWQPPPPLCTAPPVVALNLHHLFTAFLLLLLGVVAAVVFLPCEKLHWNFIGKEKAQKNELSKPAMAALQPVGTRLRPGPLGGVWHSGGSAGNAMPEDPDPTSTAYPAFQGATYGFT
ncbi:uncharacterized protein LOC122246992 [Penaeus japonicus]|uniref:uncharacterized protein LOC122246992 n=1 Tax=Penaeus japonicus TaxID=27405 RepID=UPI001C7164F4|nr:uncharacterized protein LOC122246992 [Penaeus japonicus]